MRAFLYRKWFLLLKAALKTMPADSINALGAWIVANNMAGDSVAQRATFFNSLQTETVLGGDAVTPADPE
jgi:hypothetical protein